LLAANSKSQDTIKSDKFGVPAAKEKPINDPKKNEQAFLKLIRSYEHVRDAPIIYHTAYGGKDFKTYENHPFERPEIIKKWGLRNTAAGAYQILLKTWKQVKDKVPVNDFTPESQDKVALYLIKDKRALTLVQAGEIEKAIPLLRGIWTSFPGGSQNKKMPTLKDARALFDKFVAE
jgi:lysozyme